MFQSEKGQTLMELVVVISVMVVVVGALTFATIASIRNASFAQNQLQATKLAQEGIERVRSGRDRNQPVTIPGTSVTSWNSDLADPGSIWNYPISGTSSECETEQPNLSGKCYFNISTTGQLQNIGFSRTTFPDNAESIPQDKPLFKRAITLSDDLNENGNYIDDDYQNAKRATAIVKWTDFSGFHESRLTTILRRI